MIATDRPLAAKNGAIFSYVVHSLTALLIAPVVSALFAVVAANWLPSWPARDIAFLCVVVMIGIILGCIASRVALRSEVCWVWIPGLTWLAFGIWDSARHFDPRWSQGCSAAQYTVNSFFAHSSRCNGGDGSALAGLLFTLPAISSIAYAFGACISLWAGRRKNTTASVRPT
jgi:hypothetical protein